MTAPSTLTPLSMNNISHQRRQFLFYLGLGALSAGTVTALGFSTQKKTSTATNSPVSNGPQTNGTQANGTQAGPPILASASKRLPDFQGIQQWLNSNPLTIADLKGSVVLIQFWTFACINCQRTLPYITQWHRQYAAQGLKVIGIHTPEFAFERDSNTVKRALHKHQITYPVPLDNAFKTWNAYSNQYWPHLFLADRQGLIRYDHIGEGAYDTTEQTIRQLLKER
jgi:thiol-disulfide isomerase/thioredoxin